MRIAGLVLLAVLACGDVAVAARLLTEPQTSTQLAVAAHLLIALVTGPVLVMAMAPAASERTTLGMLGVLIGFFIPGLGPLGLAAAQIVGLGTQRRWKAQRWVLLDDAPELLGNRTRHKRARRHLTAKAMAATQRDRAAGRGEQRVEDMLRASRLGGRPAVLLLKLALKDPIEEVRLFAFSRLERLRDEFADNIRALRETLEMEEGPARARTHLQLAQAHWEFVYLGLGDGAAAERALDTAEDHARRAAELEGNHSATEFLLGRILLAKGNADDAEAAFVMAERAGYPRARVVPYLAECAFVGRRFDDVRTHLRELHAPGTPLFLKPIIEFWQ
jgi:tetratricopeptide (TPR) repeat protein